MIGVEVDDKKTIKEIYRLLWSIGDSFDEMDHTDRNLWPRIHEIEVKIRELAISLPDSGSGGDIRKKIMDTEFLHLWWWNCVDLIESLTDIRR